MFGRENFMNYYNETTSDQLNYSRSLSIAYHVASYIALIVMCLASSISVLAKTANAATVYGHIYCSNDMNCSQKKITLSFFKGENLTNSVQTDNKGNYRVFLSPGSYEVKMNIKGRAWGTTIRSSSNPIRQDIYPRLMAQ